MPHETATLNNLPEYVRGLARLGRRRALVEQHLYRSQSYSYAELIARSEDFARELARRGVTAGDRVLIWGASGAAWAVAFYGSVLAGAVMVPLDAASSLEFALRVRRQTEAALVCSDNAQAQELDAPGLSFEAILALPRGGGGEAREIPGPSPETLLEIVYTSGATAEPKGVMITHGNVLANLRPIAKEVAKYKPRMRFLLPLGFLHLIPLSHLFGQIMGLLIPPMVDSMVIYPESRAPAEWARIIHQRRASAMVAVPQQLRAFSQWAEAELGVALADAPARSRGHGVLWRFWRWRKLHRKLGWKMWAYIVGGAALSSEIEEFWHALGYAVVQGYGLTETAPAIAISHPFKLRRGSVGQTLDGEEVKIAPDGEILVRGGNVSPGYFRNAEATQKTFAEGWLHTGDLGRLDADKMLVFLGRKKEVIVTPDGLNVYPDDVEQALARQPEVAEAAVVEDQRGGAGKVHAVLVLREGAGPEALDAAIAGANARLEAHQRIRGGSVWPQAQLPRTSSTHKLQRTAIARWVNQGEASAGAPASPGENRDWRRFVQQRWGIAASRMQPEARLDMDLGLSSLDRVELWSWIDAHAAAGADESRVATAQTVTDVDALVLQHALPGPTPAAAAAGAGTRAAPVPIPADERGWPLRPSLRRFRSLAYSGLVLPVLRTAVTRVTVEGRERLEGLQRPVMFIANHQSLLDVPLILRGLPRRWRPWLAPAMGIEPFLGAFDPRATGWRRRRDRWRLRWAQLIFNGYLLTPQGAVAASLRHTGRLADAGFCPLIFPEGARTPDGRLHSFRPGIGVFVASLGLPVVPIRIEGL